MNINIQKKISVIELSKVLGLHFLGDGEQLIYDIGSLKNENDNVLKFSSKDTDSLLTGIVIGVSGQAARSLLVSISPRFDFCRALGYLIENEYITQNIQKSEIHSTAQISDKAIIEDGVKIGKNTLIEHNVVIHKGTTIGNNCIIRANSVVGAQGFGFEKSSDGSWLRFPHLGGVVIENDVEIGALNSICVGALDNTIIRSGVKTDNLVHIAHNCVVGKNSILTACTELSGGVILEDSVWMGPNSSTMQKIKIGSGAVVGLGSVVTKNVEENNTVAGSPAKIIRRG